MFEAEILDIYYLVKILFFVSYVFFFKPYKVILIPIFVKTILYFIQLKNVY
jgi:hypothetical protein